MKKKIKNTIPGEWLYFSPQEVLLKDLKEVLVGETCYEIELWEEAGVLVITMQDGSAMDVETTETEQMDAFMLEFLEEKRIKTVFLITFHPDAYEQSENVMHKIIAKMGGFFCADTPDLNPKVE